MLVYSVVLVVGVIRMGNVLFKHKGKYVSPREIPEKKTNAAPPTQPPCHALVIVWRMEH